MCFDESQSRRTRQELVGDVAQADVNDLLACVLAEWYVYELGLTDTQT